MFGVDIFHVSLCKIFRKVKNTNLQTFFLKKNIRRLYTNCILFEKFKKNEPELTILIFYFRLKKLKMN